MSFNSWIQWFKRKDDTQHLFAAFFHMSTITLVCMSMVGLPWFTISGDVCIPQLTLGQFFWYNSYLSERSPEEMECISQFLINMMRIIIIFCTLVVLLSLAGFSMDILTPKHTNNMNKIIFKYAIPGTCTGSVILIMIIISISCYIVLILEDTLAKMYPRIDTDVMYGPGFYFVSTAGIVSLFGMYYTLNMVQDTGNYCVTDDDQCLIDAFDEIDSTTNPASFMYVSPPPPYNIPPPLYTP